MKYRYTGRCAAGFVQFSTPTESVRMPMGEAVEVPDWLAKKLARNPHFELVVNKEVSVLSQEEPKTRKKPGPKPKVRDVVTEEDENDAIGSEARDAS